MPGTAVCEATVKFVNWVLFATQNNCRKTNTYIVKQYFSLTGCLTKPMFWWLPRSPLYSPLGGPFQGATWREHNAQKERRRGQQHKGQQSRAVCSRLKSRGQQTALLPFTQETRVPSLYLEALWLSWQLELWSTFCRVPSDCAKVPFIVTETAQATLLPLPAFGFPTDLIILFHFHP